MQVGPTQPDDKPFKVITVTWDEENKVQHEIGEEYETLEEALKKYQELESESYLSARKKAIETGKAQYIQRPRREGSKL